MYGFAYVTGRATPSTNTIITLDRSIQAYLESDTNNIIPLTAPSDFSSCEIQLVKVANYRNIFVSGGAITASSFALNISGIGGIFVFKVSNEINIATGSSFTINGASSGNNFAPTTSGCGSDGRFTATVNHGKRCIPMGGISSGTNHGGGIVLGLVNRLNMNSATGSAMFVLANGSNAATGGDGGSIMMKYKEIIGTGNPTIIHNILGGTGTASGANGRQNLQFCNAATGITFPVGYLQGCGF
jgi:hypothetical protein